MLVSLINNEFQGVVDLQPYAQLRNYIFRQSGPAQVANAVAVVSVHFLLCEGTEVCMTKAKHSQLRVNMSQPLKALWTSALKPSSASQTESSWTERANVLATFQLMIIVRE